MGSTGDGRAEDQIIHNDTSQNGRKPLAAPRIMRKRGGIIHGT